MSGNEDTQTQAGAPAPAPAPAEAAAPAPQHAQVDNALSLLSDEEREALTLEVDGASDSGDDDDDDDGGGDGQDGAEDGEQNQAPALDGKAREATDNVANDNQDVAVAAPEPAPVAAPDPVMALKPVAPVFTYALPDDFEDQRKALNDKFTDLETRLEAGDITTVEYGRELRGLNRDEGKLDDMQRRADLARDMAQQAAEAVRATDSAEWSKAINLLIGEVKGQAVEGEADFDGDEKAGTALGVQVQAIMASRGLSPDAMVGYADKLAMLRQARGELYFRSTGKPLPSVAPAPKAEPAKAKEEGASAKAATAKERKADLSKLPQSITALPNAGGASGEEGDFQTLSDLEGEALERAMTALKQRDPAKYERFLAYGG